MLQWMTSCQMCSASCSTERYCFWRPPGWVAAGLLQFAVAFFLKHAFDNNWIVEQVRIAIGVAVAAALCVAGLGFYWRGWRLYSQMLSGGGVAILYLTTYAAFGYSHL